MVRALLDGSKTQTRRALKIQPPEDYCSLIAGLYNPCVGRKDGRTQPGAEQFGAFTEDGEWAIKCPQGQPGDQLWVRETWRTDVSQDGNAPSTFAGWPVKYEADGAIARCGSFYGQTDGKTRVSIHMPRWASRIQLEITGVRVERLQEISYEDARSEGIDPTIWPGLLTNGFKLLWESINGDGSWDANPWVWVIEFRRVRP